MHFCGRQFTPSELEIIRYLIASDPKASRYKLSVKVCEKLNWRRPSGSLKDMSCRVAMLKLSGIEKFRHQMVPVAA